MICKHCGKTIEPNQQICPHCGRSIESNEKGNGFWDMASAPKPTESPKPSNVSHDVTTPVPTKKPTFLIVAVGALAICSMVLSIVLFAISSHRIDQNREELSRSISSTRSDLDQSVSSVKKDADEQFNSLESNIDTEVSDLTNSIDALRGELDDLKGAEPTILRIVSSPIDQIFEEGYANEEGTSLFSVEVEGQVASFKWEKQSITGTWTIIDFDSSLNNPILGLSIEEDHSKGFSRLIATGLTLDAAGTYKCIVTSVDGFEKELSVNLTVQESETSPLPSDDPIATPEASDPSDENEDIESPNPTAVPTQSGRRHG